MASSSKVKIALASTSPIKIKAIQGLLNEHLHRNIDVSLHPISIEDRNQIEQPFGKIAMEMARNRIQYILQRNPYDYQIIVSMENYIDLGTKHDYGLVLIYVVQEGTEYIGRTMGIPLPDVSLLEKLLEKYSCQGDAEKGATRS